MLHKRPDGYHEIETLFARLDLADRVTLIDRPRGIRIRASAKIPKGPGNLAYRAAALLKGKGRGVEIRIEKKIPVAAGLGGGSSNAAAVLLGLNRLWKLGLSRGKLAALGARIGSDVPFFVRETPFAVGRGRGEKIKAVPACPHAGAAWRRLRYVLVKPSFGVSTRAAYAEYARLSRSKPASLTPPMGGVRILLRYLRNRRPDSLPSVFYNSLEVALNKRVNIFSRIKIALLENGASAALLCGSGSAVFGVFENEPDAKRAARRLSTGRLGKVFVARNF